MLCGQLTNGGQPSAGLAQRFAGGSRGPIAAKLLKRQPPAG
jgi:hypothetical protein